jgi:hypothetical protein
VHNLLRGLSRGCIKCRRFVGNQNPGWNGYEDIPGNLFGILKKSAEIRGIEVEITIQDLQELWEKQGGKCALSGQQLKLCSKKFGITASVDRINQKLGYTRSNIQWVHKDVNLMKNRFDEEYFIDVCRKIVDTAGG